MKISNASYQVIFSKDEKSVYNIGSTIKKFSFNDKMMELFEISKLKNLSELALSKDETLIAVLNTEGHIAIFDANNGSCIAYTKALNQEGYGIYFTSGSRVITSTWEGNIILFNYDLNKFDIINIPDAVCGKLMPTDNEDVFLLFYNNSDKNDSIQVKEININNNTVNDIFSNLKITSEIKTLFYQNGKYYFVGSFKNLDDTVYKFDYKKKLLSLILNIPQNICDKGVANCISVDKSENILALGYGNLYLFNILEKKLLIEIKTSYISCCEFFDSDNQLYIGTWTGGFSTTI